MARNVTKESDEIKATKRVERMLCKAQAELDEMAPALRVWVESYLRQKYGWFVEG